MAKGSMAFETFIVETLVLTVRNWWCDTMMNLWLVVLTTEVTDKNSPCLLECGNLNLICIFRCFYSAPWEIVMLYKTYNQTIFSGYKKSLLYHSVALAHFVRILKEKKERNRVKWQLVGIQDSCGECLAQINVGAAELQCLLLSWNTLKWSMHDLKGHITADKAQS